MSTKAQVKTQAKTPATPGLIHAGQPPLAVPDRKAEQTDLTVLLEDAARLGHSLGAIRVNSAAQSQIQTQPLIQRQPVPEGEEDEEELQMQREPAAVQRQQAPEIQDEEEQELQKKPDIPRVGLEGGPVAPVVEAAIQRARGGGKPLDSAVQVHMGETLGYDFSDVRVHTDAQADALNQQLSARAFTSGRDIFFKRNTYDPASSQGRELIGHELTHILQQSTGRIPAGGSVMTVRPAGDAFEKEADALGRQTVAPHYAPQHQHTLANQAMSVQLAQTIQRNPETYENVRNLEQLNDDDVNRIANEIRLGPGDKDIGEIFTKLCDYGSKNFEYNSSASSLKDAVKSATYNCESISGLLVVMFLRQNEKGKVSKQRISYKPLLTKNKVQNPGINISSNVKGTGQCLFSGGHEVAVIGGTQYDVITRLQGDVSANFIEGENIGGGKYSFVMEGIRNVMKRTDNEINGLMEYQVWSQEAAAGPH
ncbi:MAG: DUF4157 domain-containing protein [Anaerolineales bacterium]|jgi:hypothetical protein